MWFGKKETLQRLNLEPPKMPCAPSPAAVESNGSLAPSVNPAKLEWLHKIARKILGSGRIPDHLYICKLADGGLLVLLNGQNKVMLLFSNPFSASDYLRATGTSGTVGQFKVEGLPNLAQRWLGLGLQSAALDRCPRCPTYNLYDLAGMAKWTREDFAKVWAYHRGARLMGASIRIRSSIKQAKEGSLAAARSDLEYVRDHFDCGVPYLHQMIGIIAGMQQDEGAIATAMGRLKEFGPQFEGPLILTPESVRTAQDGMMTYFGMNQDSNMLSLFGDTGVSTAQTQSEKDPGGGRARRDDPAEALMEIPSWHSQSQPEVDPELLKSAHAEGPVEELSRLAEDVRQSHVPNSLFTVGDADVGSYHEFQHEHGPTLLLFTSPYQASDYLRCVRLGAKVVGIPWKNLETFGTQIAKTAIKNFTINCCSHCRVMNLVGIQSLAKPETVHLLWSFAIAMQHWRAARLMAAISNDIMAGESWQALLMLRNHVDCGNPYIHQVIGICAKIKADDVTFQECVLILREFWPKFDISSIPFTLPNVASDSLRLALIGLRQCYSPFKTQAAAQ
jgi:hypothetical protein